MTNVLMNTVELKQIYDYTPMPVNSLDVARNLAYKLGASSINDNKFEHQLNNLVDRGVITKVYDFSEGDFREGLYNFNNDKAQISFFGNGTDINLFYNY